MTTRQGQVHYSNYSSVALPAVPYGRKGPWAINLWFKPSNESSQEDTGFQMLYSHNSTQLVNRTASHFAPNQVSFANTWCSQHAKQLALLAHTHEHRILHINALPCLASAFKQLCVMCGSVHPLGRHGCPLSRQEASALMSAFAETGCMHRVS